MQQLPDMNELMRIARSPAGQKLMAILQASSKQDLDTIKTDAATGNMQEAVKKLSSLLQSPEAKDLLRQLERSYE